MFGKKREKLEMTRDKLLAARPRRLVEGDLVPTDDGGARLTVALRPTGVAKVLLRNIAGLKKTFELDPIGLRVWNACDGTITYEALIRDLATHLRISDREAEVATGTFLRTLMRKGLIGVEIPNDTNETAKTVSKSTAQPSLSRDAQQSASPPPQPPNRSNRNTK